jgi:hypothetical protein
LSLDMNRLQHFCEAKREAASDGDTGAKLLTLNLEKQKQDQIFGGVVDFGSMLRINESHVLTRS